MSPNRNNDKNIPTDTDQYYEELASQEEIYLEETEEEVRAILIFSDEPSQSSDGGVTLSEICGERALEFEAKRTTTDAKNSPDLPKSVDEQLEDAAEALITGDSDDPPLSEEVVEEMLKASRVHG